MDFKFISFPHAQGTVVSGDIHGSFTSLVDKCCIQYGITDTLIIVAGDCGFGLKKPGYYEDVYKKCRNKLSKDIYNYLYTKNHPLRYWYYGHFHESRHEQINDTMFHLLDIMELREIPSQE